MEQKSTLIISNYKHNNIPFLNCLRRGSLVIPESTLMLRLSTLVSYASSTISVSAFAGFYCAPVKNLKTSPGLEPEPRELQSLVIPIRLQGQKNGAPSQRRSYKKLNFCFEKLIKFFNCYECYVIHNSRLPSPIM